jgi:selenide,water dikinase
LVVGFDEADDAGVYKISAEQALVQTVDFFTPIVDDPFTFGAIAATNALSDVYAMGGRPLTALALVCFPEKGDLAVLERILAGGLDKMIEAGCTVVGGHSIRDEEIKFGYSVTGMIHPGRIFANNGAKAGDALVLSKAIGTGVISTAIKKAKAKPEWIDAATKSMTTLNKTAAEIMGRPEFGVHTATDITGFGLIGHARELAKASKVALHFCAGRVPLLAGAKECVEQGFIPGGLKNNRDFAECNVEYEGAVDETLKALLFDPQTAGGLLIALPKQNADALVDALRAAGLPAKQVGEVLPQRQPLISVS